MWVNTLEEHIISETAEIKKTIRLSKMEQHHHYFVVITIFKMENQNWKIEKEFVQKLWEFEKNLKIEYKLNKELLDFPHATVIGANYFTPIYQGWIGKPVDNFNEEEIKKFVECSELLLKRHLISAHKCIPGNTWCPFCPEI
jgi:hypothetical protein